MKRQPPKVFTKEQICLLINKHNLFIVFVNGMDFLLSKDYLLNAKITNGVNVIPFIDIDESFLMDKQSAMKSSSQISKLYEVAGVLSVMQCHRIF